MHCAKAPCVEVCPVKASYYRDDGIVMMDYDRCIGCRYCEVACPYEARSFNWKDFDGPNPAVPEWGQPEIERRPRGVVEKCSFCYQRIDRGLSLGLQPGVDADATPACCVVCPTGARVFGDLNDPEFAGQPAPEQQRHLPLARRTWGQSRACTTSRRSDQDGGVMFKQLNILRSRIRISPWLIWLAVLSSLLVAASVGGLMVFSRGLWLTNLTDRVPWGLWITLDLSSIALSAGAFSLCAAVYLIGLKRYEPIARTATFVGLIGYTMAMLSLLLDIGRPDRFWHALVYWNGHSLLWEVTMCVMLYLTVLILESMPIFAHLDWLKRRFPAIAGKMSRVHHYAPYLAIAGLALSSLHQSSLGGVYGVLKARPIWYKPEMTVLFMLSAIIGGIALTLFASMLSARLTARARTNDLLIERVARFLAWALVGYLYFRFWDVFAQHYTYEPGRTEGMELLTGGPLSFNFWVLEMLLGSSGARVMLLNPRTRQHPFWRMAALALVVIGVIAYRWDTNLSGLLVVMPYIPGQLAVSYASYSPSLIEIVTATGNRCLRAARLFARSSLLGRRRPSHSDRSS